MLLMCGFFLLLLAIPGTPHSTEISAPATPEQTSPTTGKENCPAIQVDANLIQVLDNKCYYFNIDTRLTFEHAKTFCESHGGKLANAGSENITNFLVDNLAHLYHQNDLFWVRNYHLKGRDYDCFAFNPQHRDWYDIACSNVFQIEKFVCEFDLNQVENTPKPSLSPQGHVKLERCLIHAEKDELIPILNQTCYLFNFTHKLNFNEAENYCESIGGHLAFVKSKEVNDFLINHLTITLKQEGSFWIGMHYNYHDYNFDWLDGTHSGFQNFRNSYRLHSCVTLNTVDGKWDTHLCPNAVLSFLSVTRFPFICEFSAKESNDMTTTRPQTTQLTTTHNSMDQRDNNLTLTLDDKCYYFNKDSKLSYVKADFFCEKYGGRLATVDTEIINSFLNERLLNTNGQNDYFWIGNIDCFALNPQDGNLYSLDCSQTVPKLQYFICEFEITENINTTQQSTDSQGCPMIGNKQNL